jgi:hypothetical protein
MAGLGKKILSSVLGVGSGLAALCATKTKERADRIPEPNRKERLMIVLISTKCYIPYIDRVRETA